MSCSHSDRPSYYTIQIYTNPFHETHTDQSHPPTPPQTKTTSTQTDIPKPLPMKGTISLQIPPTPKPAKSTLPDIRHPLPTKPSWTATQDQNHLQECFVKLHMEQCQFHNQDTPVGALVPVRGSLAEVTCKYDKYLTVMEPLKQPPASKLIPPPPSPPNTNTTSPSPPNPVPTPHSQIPC